MLVLLLTAFLPTADARTLGPDDTEVALDDIGSRRLRAPRSAGRSGICVCIPL